MRSVFPRREALAALLLAVAAAACSSAKPPVPGKSCTINSDCDSPLSCTYNKCHEACREDGDCALNYTCVYSTLSGTDAGGPRYKVCVYEPCVFDSICPKPLVCGRDLKCRNQCEADIDCPGAKQKCVIGGPHDQKVCAEPEAVEADGGVLMTLPGGGFPPVGEGAGGTGGSSSGAGGSGGLGGSSGAGGGGGNRMVNGSFARLDG